MKLDQTTSSGHPSGLSEMNQQITNAVGWQRHLISLLTVAVLAAGFAAMLASVGLVAGYFIGARPKYMQLMRDVGTAPHLRPNGHDNNETYEPTTVEVQGALIALSHGTSVGMVLVALATGLSAGGAIVTQVLIVFSRRVTLRQINASLAQISLQLKELQQHRDAGAGPVP
ncbi:MAG TPA: hypothetical protein VMF06_20295 [Candidatus Limnocylindria bacterium]|jgi:hypothetical protein|nr:hypothetical protein [Candidatus Limnocylindria bacterium]